MDKSILDRVIKIFADFKKVPTEEITPAMTFEELGFDSLDGLNLIFEIEDEFDIMVPDNRLEEMKSVSQVAEGIEYLLAHPEEQATAQRPSTSGS